MRLVVMLACATVVITAAACSAKPQPVASPERRAAQAPVAATPPAVVPEESGETHAQRELRLAREDYDAAIATATAAGQSCRTDPGAIDSDVLLDAYAILAPYERSPARDQAIGTLELCRRLAVDRIAATMPTEGSPRGTGASSDVRRAVDERSKRTTKPLRFVVRGKKVTVEEKYVVEKKPRDAKALQGYCARADAPDDGQIDVVSAENSAASCSSAFSFSKQPTYVLERAGLDQPLSLESTQARKTPVAAAPAPP